MLGLGFIYRRLKPWEYAYPMAGLEDGASMIVKSIEVYALDLPLVDDFEISLGTKEMAANVLVRLETGSGTVGWGEAAPLEPITGETQASALATTREGAGLLEDRDLRDLRGLSRELHAALPDSNSAQFALETALYDAYCRERGITLAECFGGTPEPVTTDITVSLVDSQAAVVETKTALERGFNSIKVKVGSDFESDIKRVAAVRDVASDIELKVDANQGWTPSEAVRFVDRAEANDFDLALVEQPVHRDDLAGLKRVTDATSVPVAADEAVFTPEDAIRIVRERAADVINIKAAKSGLTDSVAIAEIARAANLEVMIGCMLESALGLHASAHLVAGVGGFSYIDLDGNQSLIDDVTDMPQNPTLDITGPGHGIIPEESILAERARRVE